MAPIDPDAPGTEDAGRDLSPTVPIPAPPMVAATVVASDGTPKRVVTVIDQSASEALRAIGDAWLDKMNVATNGKKSSPKTRPVFPDIIPEFEETGVHLGKPTKFTAIKILGFDKNGKPVQHTVDKNAGYDWLFMAAAAKKEGIVLLPNSVFRSPAEQEFLIKERMAPPSYTQRNAFAIKNNLGIAGKIGTGSKLGAHLMAQAIDIGVGLGINEFAAILIRDTPEEIVRREELTTGSLKRVPPYTAKELEAKLISYLQGLALQGLTRFIASGVTANFRWLTDNAPKYGFVRDTPSEAWHWSHKKQLVVTQPTTAGEKVDPVVAAVTSLASTVAAIQTDKPDAARLLDRTIHDTTKAQERSVLMARTGRQQLFAESGRASVFQGAALQSFASRYQTKQAAAVLPAPVYVKGSVKQVSLDYATGLWGNGGTT